MQGRAQSHPDRLPRQPLAQASRHRLRQAWVLLVLILLACAALLRRYGLAGRRCRPRWSHLHPHGPPVVVRPRRCNPQLSVPPRLSSRGGNRPRYTQPARYAVDLRVAGVLVAGTASTLAMLGAWFWCRMAFGWRTACIATLMFGMTRKWSALGADVLSDSLALCPMVWSLVVGLWATQAMRRQPGRGVLLLSICGLLGGLGYCVRPEAAAVPCIVVLMLLADQLLRGAGAAPCCH